MNFLGVTVDGTTYRVRIVYDTYVESVELIEGPLAGDMESGRHERDLKGAAATYEMTVEPDPRYPADYDNLWTLLRSPEPSHSVTVYENQGTLTYDAQIQAIQRTYAGELGGRKRWKGMTLSFVPQTPQWRTST